MPAPEPMDLDLVIFGGGAAGLWLLDAAVRRGFHVLLLEAHALGSGQTICSQGILHGGTKYSLGGLVTPSARAIRDMPGLWRTCLDGQADPDLSTVTKLADFTYLWQSDSISSKLGMLGARSALRVKPVDCPPEDRPDVMKSVSGVARLNEQVIDPQSLLSVLFDRHRDRVLKIDPEEGVTFEWDRSRQSTLIQLRETASGAALNIRPRTIVLCAGEGNASLRASMGLSNDIMQRRPLHMAMARGELPSLHGHCVEGAGTRLTVTSSQTSRGEIVWQLGGRIAEDGVDLEPTALVEHAIEEVRAVLPDVELKDVSWTTYRVNRAEGRTRSGMRPEGVTIKQDDNVLTCWPTKLVLAPQLAKDVLNRMDEPTGGSRDDLSTLRDWPRPDVALPPWEVNQSWS